MDILDKIKPTEKEQITLDRRVNNFLGRLNTSLNNAKAMAGGSYAKNTWLRGNYDIDIFVKYRYSLRKQDISKLLEKTLRKAFSKVTRIHGSRDYFHVKSGKYLFEVVPVLDIKRTERALNVTDVSPLHVEYVKKNANEKLKNEVRILKQFCKANSLYGAESYIKGFSGYVTELLIIYYKSFDNLIKNATKWKEKQVIDPLKYYKNKEEILRELNASKKYSPLILIDPVQKDRNAAAALSKEKFDLFITLAKEYLKNPSEIFFIEKEVAVNELRGYTIIKVRPIRGKKDIIGAKLLKDFELIKNKLDEFEVIDAGWKWNNVAYFYFKTRKKKLSKYKRHFGPSRKHKEHLENFKRKWGKYRFNYERGRIYINLKRKIIDIKGILKDVKTNNNILSIK